MSFLLTTKRSSKEQNSLLNINRSMTPEFAKLSLSHHSQRGCLGTSWNLSWDRLCLKTWEDPSQKVLSIQSLNCLLQGVLETHHKYLAITRFHRLPLTRSIHVLPFLLLLRSLLRLFLQRLPHYRHCRPLLRLQRRRLRRCHHNPSNLLFRRLRS